jgi:hypothetical protein
LDMYQIAHRLNTTDARVEAAMVRVWDKFAKLVAEHTERIHMGAELG